MLSKTIGGLIMQAIAVIFFVICCFSYQAQAIPPAAIAAVPWFAKIVQQRRALRNESKEIGLRHTENALQIQKESFKLYSEYLLKACNPNRHLTELQQKEIERLKQANAQLKEIVAYYEKRLLK